MWKIDKGVFVYHKLEIGVEENESRFSTFFKEAIKVFFQNCNLFIIGFD